MTDASRFPRDDVVKKGPAVCRTGWFGTQHECTLTLRGFIAPFRLEIFVVSTSGKVYCLDNIKRVKFCGPFNQSVSLKIRFCSSVSLYLSFINEREASEWMEAIQMRSLAARRRTALTDLRFHVMLLPNSNCHLNGQHLLIVTSDAIRLCDSCDMTPRIVWPVHTLRFYGNKGNIFSVATTSRSETGEGLFHFDALYDDRAKQIYYCVAASVTCHLLQVAGSCSSVPPPRPPRLPCCTVPHSTPTYDRPSNPSNASPVDGFTIDDYWRHVSSTKCFASPESKEAFVWNCFYLKQFGASVKKPTKMPKIYGLGEPKRELLDVFSLETDPLERFAFSAVLYGPPNCGKQLLVEAAAVHCGTVLLCLPARCLLQLIRTRGHEIQILFDVAMALAPCIILIKQLQLLFPSSSASESDCACHVLQMVRDVFGTQSKRTVAVVGTINDLSVVDDPLTSLHWMGRKIYVPPPCLETRREVFAKELQGLLSSPEGSSCLALLAQTTAGFDFVQLTDLYRDLKRMALSDAFDDEPKSGRCDMTIRDQKKVEQVLEQNVCERRAYEESGLSSARYYALLHSQESALFVVKLMANEMLSGVSHCFLRLSDSSIDLLHLDPTQTIVSWQLKTIRRFTWEPLSFVVEVGRKSPTKAGEFHFETTAAKTISDCLKETLQMRKLRLDSANQENENISTAF